MVGMTKKGAWAECFCSVRWLIFLWCILISLIPIYFLLHHYWPLYKARQYYESTSFRMANLERGGLPFFIERQRRSVLELSRSVYMQNLITFTQDQSEITEQQVLKMESFIGAYREYFGYKHVLLLNKKGSIVFSTAPGLRGKNVNDEAYQNGLIVASFKLASMTLSSDITPFSYSPVLQEKAIFITMPVFFDGALNGFLVVQLDNKEIEHMLAKIAAFEGAEEYLIVQRIHNMITFIVPPISQPDLVLPVRPEISLHVGAPSERVALGYEGYGITDNHLGEPVVGAWYFLPQLNWGFVCKDTYVYAMRYVRWFGYCLVFLLMIALLITCACILLKKRKKIVEQHVLSSTEELNESAQ